MVPIWVVTPFEWNFSMVKKINAFKKLILMLLLQEICQYTEFTVCHLQLRIAMKWIEIAQPFQVWTKWIPKLWIVFSRKNSLAVFFGL